MVHETATLSGGCFWCLQPIFEELRGVHRVECGYSGGHVLNPTYEQVCTGATWHAEAVQIVFDPADISYLDLLRTFFMVHNPTTLNRQGNDVGTQYRSAIFYHSASQEEIAKSLISELNGVNPWGRPIITELTPFKAFFRAEEHHQDYYQKNPEGGYCVAIIAPKLKKFRRAFKDKIKG